MRERDFRKVDDSACNMVDVVAENVQRDMGHRLDDLAVAQPCTARVLKARGPQLTPLHHDAVRELEDGIGSGIGCISLSSLRECLLGQSQLAGNEGMGAEAVRALIRFSDGERDLLTNLRAETSIRKGGTEIEVALERGRRIAQHTKQIGDNAQFPLHAFKERFGWPGGGLGIELCDAIHDASVGWWMNRSAR